MILKLFNKILILFEIFCTNKYIHLTQKNFIQHWLELFSEIKKFTSRKIFSSTSKMFSINIEFLGLPEITFIHTQNICYIK